MAQTKPGPEARKTMLQKREKTKTKHRGLKNQIPHPTFDKKYHNLLLNFWTGKI